MCRKKERHSMFFCMLSLVTAITVIAGLIMGIVVMCERKKKDEEELERYLDGVIQ